MLIGLIILSRYVRTIYTDAVPTFKKHYKITGAILFAVLAAANCLYYQLVHDDRIIFESIGTVFLAPLMLFAAMPAFKAIITRRSAAKKPG